MEHADHVLKLQRCTQDVVQLVSVDERLEHDIIVASETLVAILFKARTVEHDNLWLVKKLTVLELASNG